MASGHLGLACVVNMVLQHHALESQALGATLQLEAILYLTAGIMWLLLDVP